MSMLSLEGWKSKTHADQKILEIASLNSILSPQQHFTAGEKQDNPK